MNQRITYIPDLLKAAKQVASSNKYNANNNSFEVNAEDMFHLKSVIMAIKIIEDFYNKSDLQGDNT